MRSPTIHLRRGRAVEPEPHRPVLALVGIAWTLITLALLGIMLVPFAYGAIDLIMHLH
ncbi:hypothetical protein GCM10009798_37460 [Nocardioides panacihumi]|uniref:Uncharacterized protein n=1 Tax=Nocardioides panacihumi TaxID=400774 RepID=A0ABP5D1Z1_9ACTN